MTFAELTKRMKLSPSKKTDYLLRYAKLIDKEKLFIQELIRISYNLGRQDVIQQDIENHKRLFPEPDLTTLRKSNTLLPEAEKKNLTGLKSKRGKSNGTNKSKRP